MFDKLEFSDLYKFITSIGLIIIGSAFLLPWLFMKNELGIELSTEDYNNLITEAKTLADQRISLNLAIVRLIPWISVFLFLIGLGMTVLGLIKWKKKQAIVDQSEDLRLAELRYKVESMSPKEAKEKAKEEVDEEIKIDSKSKVETDAQKSKAVEKLIDMENLFLRKIENFNSFNYEVKQNAKITKEHSVDILLQALNKKTCDDIMIDIKFIQNQLNITFVKESYTRFRAAHSNYTYMTKRNTKMKFIVVYKNDIADEDQINRFKSACQVLEKEINLPSFRLYLMSETEALNFDIKKIIS